MIVSFGLHSRWVHRNYTWSRNDVGSSITTCSTWLFHMTIFCFFPATLMSSTFADKNTLVFDERTYIPNTEFSPVQGSVFELSLPKQSSQWVTAQVSSKKFHGIFNYPFDLGHLCRGRRIQTSGLSVSGILSSLGASSSFTWDQADSASAACPSQPGNLALTSIIFFAAVIWDADEPCSVNTA